MTGTSVLAIKYREGIMMAADCLASYGSLARFRDQERMAALGETTLMGSSGDISDFQFTLNMLKRYQYIFIYMNVLDGGCSFILCD